VIRPFNRREVERLVADLDASDVRREAAVARLVAIGPPAADCLVAAATDTARSGVGRAAALRALDAIGDPQALQSVIALIDDGDPNVAQAAVAVLRTDVAVSVLRRAADGALPDEADQVRHLVAIGGAGAPLSVLQRIVDRLRERETAEPENRQARWAAARAAVHQTLAERGSRAALYDLRESIATAPGPLPIGFIAAASLVGDVTCLEPLAAAYVRSTTARDTWWRAHLADAFRAIQRRDRVPPRHPALKRIASRWPDVAVELSKPSRKAGPRPPAGRT
jgi:hypothetical protein